MAKSPTYLGNVVLALDAADLNVQTIRAAPRRLGASAPTGNWRGPSVLPRSGGTYHLS